MNMTHNMAALCTGDADVDLRTNMFPRHQSAIDMANGSLTQAKDPVTKRMAQTIIDEQEKEIAEMQARLKKNDK